MTDYIWGVSNLTVGSVRNIGNASEAGHGTVRRDASNNVYTVYVAYGSGAFNIYNSNGTVHASVSPSTANNFYVIKRNSSGTVQWYVLIGGNGGMPTPSIDIDTQQNVYVGGFIYDNVTVTDATGATATISRVGSFSSIFVKFNASGVRQFSINPFNANVTSLIMAIKCVGTDVYVGGECDTIGSVTLINSSNIGYRTTSASAGTIFLLKYNSSGNLTMAYRLVNAAARIFGITTDSSDNIYVCGRLTYNSTTYTFLNNNGINTETTSSVSIASTTAFDGFLVKYNSSGITQWGIAITGNGGTSTLEACAGVVCDASNNVYTHMQRSSSTALTVRYNNTTTIATLSSLTAQSGYVFAFTPNGGYIYTVSMSPTGGDGGVAGIDSIIIDSKLNMYITGAFSSSTCSLTRIGSGSSTTLTKKGGVSDVYIARLHATTGAYETHYLVSSVNHTSGYQLSSDLAIDSANNILWHGMDQTYMGAPSLASLKNKTLVIAFTLPSSPATWARLYDFNSGGIDNYIFGTPNYAATGQWRHAARWASATETQYSAASSIVGTQTITTLYFTSTTMTVNTYSYSAGTVTPIHSTTLTFANGGATIGPLHFIKNMWFGRAIYADPYLTVNYQKIVEYNGNINTASPTTILKYLMTDNARYQSNTTSGTTYTFRGDTLNTFSPLSVTMYNSPATNTTQVSLTGPSSHYLSLNLTLADEDKTRLYDASNNILQTFPDGLVSSAMESTLLLKIRGENSLPTGAVTITGTLAVGQVVTANTSAIADSDGPSPITSFSYQWLVSNDNITYTNMPSATSQSITLTASESGKYIRVTVGYTDSTGTTETVTSAGMLVATVPSAPASATATVNSSSQITVSWTPPTSTGGAALTYYVIRGYVGASLTIGPLYSSPSDSFRTITTAANGLVAGTTYTFTVTAENSVGEGPTATTNSATLATVPGAPTSVTATRGNASATVSFTDPASNGGATITRYNVVSSPGGIDVSGASSPIIVTGLTNGTAYTFTVTATNSVGTGSASSASNSVTPGDLPSTVSVPTAIAGNNKITVSWSPPSSNGYAITSYTVQPCDSDGNATGSSVTVLAPSTTVDVSGLTLGTSYTFRVSATNSLGTSSPSSQSTPAVVFAKAPDAPTITGVIRGDSQVTVSWSAPAANGSAITSYSILPYLASNGNLVSAKVYVAQSTDSTATITGLTNGTAYYFQMTATNAVGTSSESTQSADVTPATNPGVPTDVSGTPGNGQVTLSWTAPTDTGGVSLTNYRISRYLTDTNEFIVGIFTGDISTSKIITGLNNGTSYYFKVRAYNSAGASEESSASNSVIPYFLPGAPTITSVDASGLTLTVNILPSPVGQSSIGMYRVSVYDLANAGNTVYAAQLSTSIEVTLSGYGDYEVDVVAENENGIGDVSTRYPISVLSVPSAPENLSVMPGNESATLIWSDPTTIGGRAISKYSVETYLASNNSQVGSAIDVSASPTTKEITGLTNGTAYYFKVYAYNAVGISLDAQSSSTTPRTVPNAPTGVAGAPDDSQVEVSWTAPASNGGATITSYAVQAYLASTDASAGSPVGVSGDVTTATVASLTNGTAYRFKVTATNVAGTSVDSSASDPVTPRTVPDAPTSPSATPGINQVTVSWTAPAYNGGAAITSYTVNTYVGLSSSPSKQTTTADGSSTTVDVTGLANGTLYRFKVFATNEAGDSILSSQVSATPRTTPSVPQSVSAIAGKESVSLSWSAPLMTGGAAIEKYTIRDASSNFIADVSANPRTYSHTGLTANSTYFYVITASNEAGESSSSETVSATPYTNPGAPTITSVDAGNRQAILTWSAAAANSSAITNYRITSIPGSITHDVSGTSQTGTIAGLTNGTSYTFTVTATNAGGDTTSTDSSSAVVPNALPTGPFTVVDQDTGLGTAYSIGHVLTVSNGISDEDGFQTPFSYKWQHADTSGGSFVDISGATASTYTIVLADLNKYFRCVASYTDGADIEETYTTTNVAGPVVKAVPYAPTGVTATEGHLSAIVSWTAPTNDGGDAITGYVIISSPMDISATIMDALAVSGEITGLTAGTAYTFIVRAINAIGLGQASDATSPAVTPYTVPNAPTDVTAIAGKNSATVTWTEPFNNWSTITEYTVKAYRAGVYVSTETNTLPTETVTFTNLDRNVSYMFIVTATNAAGTSLNSSTSNDITPYDNPEAPTLYNVNPSNKLATVSYTLGYDNSNPITLATLTARVVDSSEQVTSSFVPSSGVAYTDISGLRNGVAYEFFMTATNAAGESVGSNVVSERVVDYIPYPLIMNAPPVDNVSIVLADTGASAMTYYVGQTLTTDISSNANALTDEDDISGEVSHQWQSFYPGDGRESASDISGATQSTYQIGPELAGKQITAYVSYTDGVGIEESVALQAHTSTIQPSVPDAPASIDVSSTLGQIVVSWTAPASNGGSEILGYTIYMENLTNSNYSFSVTPSQYDTSTTITLNTVEDGLRIGHEYSITVKATNSVGEGAATSAVTTIFLEAPTPTITEIYPYYDIYSEVGEIIFSWSAVYLPNSLFARYEIYDASADTLLLTHTGSIYGPSGYYRLSIQDVSGGIPYSIKMRTVIAYNGTEYTGAFSAASSTVTSVSKPNPPTAVTATGGNQQIEVTWTAPTYTGGRDINHYRIYYANADQSVNEDISANADASSVTITDLTNGELFTVSVKTVISYAENQYDWDGAFIGTLDVLVYSAETFANNSTQVQVGRVPDAPTITSVTPGDGTIEVSFSPPGFDGGLTISGYTVIATDGTTTHTASGSSSPITVTGLTNGTAYTCTVKATNLAGDSDPSTASDSVTPRTTPNAPTITSVTRGNAEITVEWDDPAFNGGSAITGYTVKVYDASDAVAQSVDVSATPRIVTITGLTNGVTYTVKVLATNVAGSGSESSASDPVTPATFPGAPTSVSAVRGNAQATVSFTPPASDGGDAITRYIVTSSPGGIDASGSSSPITVTGLTNGTAYTFTVRATNAVGTSYDSSASDPVTPATFPDAPTEVTATRGDTRATVSWTAPASNGGAALTKYTIQAYNASTNATVGSGVDVSASDASGIVTGLTNGTAYYFTVTATNSAGTSVASTASSSVTPAGVPITSSANSVLQVTFNDGELRALISGIQANGASITNYTFYVYIDSTKTLVQTIDVSSIPGSGVVINGLTNGTSYVFRVKATNAVGTSDFTPYSSSNDPKRVSDPPTSVTATAGATSASVSFTPPVNDGGRPIIDYTVTSSPGNRTATGASAPITVSGLTAGLSYTFTVTARNAVGSSSASSASSSVVPYTTPGAPRNVVGTGGNASVSVAFDPPLLDGSSAILDYTVTSSGGQTATGASSPILVTGLSNGTSYTFTVRARNAAGLGTASSPSASVAPFSVPASPTGVTASPGNTQITVSWTAPANAGGGTISNYKVYVYDGSSNLLNTITTADTSASRVVTSLTNGSPYRFRVSAVTEVGEGLTSSLTDVVIPRTVPDAPTNVLGTEDNQQVTVSWTEPAWNGGNAISKYTVYTYDSSSNLVSSSDVSAGTITKTVTSLTNGRYYTFRVSATNEAGEGALSTTSLEYKPRTVPNPPTDVSGAYGNAQVAVSFTPPADNGGADVMDYHINATPGDFNEYNVVSSPATITGLTNGTSYVFKMRARNVAGYSTWSANSASVTPRTTPNAPLITGTIAGDGNVEVSFNAGFNGGALVSSYTVTATTDTSGTVTQSGSTSPITVSGLTNGLTYTLKVKATNSEGTGPDSSGQTAIPTKPVAELESGIISKVEETVFAIGTTVVTAKSIEVPAPDVATGLSTVAFIPDNPLKPTVQVQNVPEAVADVTIGVSAPNEAGVAYIKIVALDAEGAKVRTFTDVPLKIRVTLPGFTSAMVTLQTSDTLGGPITDTITAYRIGLSETYEFTTTHLTYFSASQYVPCFVAGTRILTAEGYKAVETLTADDLIRTADNRIVPFRMFKTHITATSPETAPYTIPANTFGRACPATELTVSPYHAIQSAPNTWQIPKYAAKMFRGITQARPGQPITYYHLELPNYFKDNIVAEGTVVESYGNRQTVGMKTVYRLNETRTGFTRLEKPKSASKTA